MSADRFYGDKRYGDAMKMEVFGDAQLDALFNMLKDSQKKSVMVASFRKASKPIIEDTKANLQARAGKITGNLLRSIGSKPDSYLPILRVGARRGGGFAGYHAHLIDSGTKERFYVHKKSGKEHKTGKVQGTDFFKDAVQSNQEGVLRAVSYEMEVSFGNFIQRYNLKRKT